MGSTDGEHLGLDLSHVFSGHRRALVGVKPRGDAAPTGEGARDFPPHPQRGTHHPRVGEEEAVLRWWGAGFEMGEEGLLRPKHLDGGGGQFGQASAPSCAHAQPGSQHGTNQSAEARKVRFSEGAQGGLQPIQPRLNVNGRSPMIAEAPPLRTSGQVQRGLKPQVPSQAPQIVGFAKGSSGAQTILVQVQVWQEEAEPFHKTGEAHVARLTHFLHRSMQVFEAPIEVACSVGDAPLCKSEGSLIQEGEVLGRDLGQLALTHGFNVGFWESLKQLRCFGGQACLRDALEALNGPLHAATTGPPEAVHLHAVLVDEDRDVPVMEEAHIVTNGPWAKTLRSEGRASEASK